jgi:hypothetical protein
MKLTTVLLLARAGVFSTCKFGFAGRPLTSLSGLFRQLKAPLFFWFSPKFALKPAIGNVSCDGIDSHFFGFGVAALPALEGAMFEAFGARGYIGRQHPHGALETARTLDG